jgi:hypothetical protein
MGTLACMGMGKGRDMPLGFTLFLLETGLRNVAGLLSVRGAHL